MRTPAMARTTEVRRFELEVGRWDVVTKSDPFVVGNGAIGPGLAPDG
jgi:hypothetical protein